VPSSTTASKHTPGKAFLVNREVEEIPSLRTKTTRPFCQRSTVEVLAIKSQENLEKKGRVKVSLFQGERKSQSQ